MAKLSFIGFNKLDSFDRVKIKDLVSNYADKMERDFKRITLIKLHYKPYKTEGTKQKYSLHLHIEGASKKPLAVSHMQKAAEWDVVRATRRVLVKAMNLLGKAFKDAGKNKPRPTLRKSA